jgi:hypothetical protein
MYINCKVLEMGRDETGRKEDVYNEGHIGNCGLERVKKSNGYC